MDQLEHPRENWWDLRDPTPEILRGIADRFGLHPTSVQDCLDPEHFPKIEMVGDTLFIILRCYDSKAPAGADELLTLTRKLAFFLRGDHLITIHRGDQPFLNDLRNKAKHSPLNAQETAVRLMKGCVESFLPYLEYIEQQIEALEKHLVTRPPDRGELLTLYQLRSKLNVVKRQGMHANAVIREFTTVYATNPGPWLTDLRESAEQLWLYCDEVMEDVQNLLSLHLALSSHRTTEVMRVLTVVSLFFFPLTFIVGIYGMNFRFMPELEWRYGYAATWGVMILVSILIYWKVRQKGWLNRE
jgi:magnesium transporter